MPLTLSGNGTVSGVNTDIGMRIITPTSVSGGSLNTGGSVSFSSSTSITVNGCFSSTYKNYRILITMSSTSDSYLNMQLCSSGTPLSTGNVQYYAGVYTNGSAVSNGSSIATGGNVMVPGYHLQTISQFIIDISNPYESLQTVYTSQSMAIWSGIGVYMMNYGGGVANTSQYDGIKFYSSAANVPLTGTFKVYGYNNG